jgi:protein-tyrosine-phosphatase
MSDAAKNPSSVLFMCDMNSIRSPMAASLLKHFAGNRIYVASAGIYSGEPDNFATSTMREVDIDMSGHQPHTLEDLSDLSFDLIITLSNAARHEVAELAKNYAFETEHWVIDDPSVVKGSREAVMLAYRTARDILKRRIEQRFSA